jgi:SAM-dependent methyltransferase
VDSKSYRGFVYDRYVAMGLGAPDPAQLSQHNERWSLAAFQRVAQWLPSNRSAAVLDVGCGYGAMLATLKRVGFTNLTGVDRSESQVLAAKTSCVEARVIHGDLLEFLRHHKSAYELIICFDVIEHFDKTEILELLSLIHSALVPGGRLILQTPNAESPFMGSVAFGDFTHEWCFTPSSLGGLLLQSGFTGYEVRENGPSPHGAVSFIRTILWAGCRLGFRLLNYIESGGEASGIYTRVFMATCLRPDA